VFISLTTTYLLFVPAKLGVAPSSLVRIVGCVADSAVVAWYVVFARVTNTIFGRDLISTGYRPNPSPRERGIRRGAE
jgi:hypothetical protein